MSLDYLYPPLHAAVFCGMKGRDSSVGPFRSCTLSLCAATPRPDEFMGKLRSATPAPTQAIPQNPPPIHPEYSDVTHRIRNNDLAATGHTTQLPRICDTVPSRGPAMLKWLVRFWHRINDWMRRRISPPSSPSYHRANLHGRHR